MNVFTAIGIATVVIIAACIVLNNLYHKKYASMVSQAQADVSAGQKAVTQAVSDVQKAASDVKVAAAAIQGKSA